MLKSVLKELGIDPAAGTVIEVWNKADLLSEAERDRLTNLARRKTPQPLLVSSADRGGRRRGQAHLIEARIADTRTTFEISLDAADGAGASWLYRNAESAGKSRCRTTAIWR